MALTRKTVLITGCSDGGIGSALASEFQSKGYHVFATARTPSKISPSLASAPNVTVLTLDVVSAASISAAADSVSKLTGGKLDFLVNNSGSTLMLPGLDVDIEEGKKLFDLNFWAALSMIQAFAPLLIASKGCVVNNTSIAGPIPFLFQSIYNASKAALISASESWRLELEPLGVSTITLLSGGVKTNFFANFTPTPLPSSSYYTSVAGSIEQMGDGRMQEGAMDVQVYAKAVVQRIDGRRAGKYWVGGFAGIAKWAVWGLPSGIVDKIVRDMCPWLKDFQYQAVKA